MTRPSPRSRASRPRVEKAGAQDPAQAIRAFFAALQAIGARSASTPAKPDRRK